MFFRDYSDNLRVTRTGFFEQFFKVTFFRFQTLATLSTNLVAQTSLYFPFGGIAVGLPCP